MRTTVVLPDALREAAKERAAASGRTLTSLIEEGLRTVLAQPLEQPRPIPLPSYGTGTDDALIDLTDKDAVWDVLDSDGRK